MATLYRIDEVVYSIMSHRNAEGHFAAWQCDTCGSAGGISGICADAEGAIEAARLLIAGHHSRRHPDAVSRALFSIAYNSQAVQAFSQTDLEELASRAAAKNGMLDVTGYLTYDVDFETFFQFLEGPRAVVEGLMSVIARDPRHRILNVVPISKAERQFAAASAAAFDWSLPANLNELANLRIFSSWRMQLVTKSHFQVMEMEEMVWELLATMRKAGLGGEYVTGEILDLSYQLKTRAPLAML